MKMPKTLFKGYNGTGEESHGHFIMSWVTEGFASGETAISQTQKY